MSLISRALGIDVGGSAVKVGVLAGRALESVERVAHSARGLEAVTEAVERAWRGLPEDTRELPFGVAVAGLVREGVVVRSGNLGLVDAPLRRALESALGRPTSAFLSDARALGVAVCDAEAGESVLVALGLGTGVGGSLVVAGRVVRETGLGHGVVLPESALAPCALGHPACLEAFLGAAALVGEARALGLEATSPAAIDSLADGGDPRARGVLERAGERLALGVGIVLAEAGHPGGGSCLVLSGGVAASETLRLAAARALVPAGVRVALSRFGSDAPVAGAALAALL